MAHASEYLTAVLAGAGRAPLPYAPNHKRDVYDQLMAVVERYPSLSVRDDPFTHNDGRVVHLLRADGTVPIFYHGVKYNIPLKVYLPENFPATAPICYVHPTPSMIIKPGHTLVDGSGLVRSRYLDRWNVRAGSTIADLSTSLSEAFGDDPPLYAKPAGTSTRSTQSQSQSQSHSTYPAANANAAGATYPAPPGRGGGPSYRAPHRPPHPSEATNAYGYPTSAPETRGGVGGVGDRTAGAAGAAGAAAAVAGESGGLLGQQRRLQELQRRRAEEEREREQLRADVARERETLLRDAARAGAGAGGPSPPPPPPSTASASSAYPSPPTRANSFGDRTAAAAAAATAEATFKSRAVSALSSRLSGELERAREATNAEAERLLALQAEIARRRAIVEEGLESLRRERRERESRVGRTAAATTALRAWLEENESKLVGLSDDGAHGDGEDGTSTATAACDAAFPTEDAWSDQILRAVARDNALEDAMDCLDENLERQKIDLDDYLRLTRTLAKEQFFARAEAMAVRKKQTERGVTSGVKFD